MKWTIVESLKINTEDFEIFPLVDPLGFREYDARWKYPEQINLLGLQCLGSGIATQLWELGYDPPRVIVGHDYREYSMAVKKAMTVGLMAAGAHVYDIGLGITPMAYFARLALGVSGLAMVTASHNENPWTGVKIGAESPLTHGPEEMKRLRDIVMNGEYKSDKGSYESCIDIREKYIKSFLSDGKLNNRLKVVVDTGNGTAGMFAPQILETLGCEVIRINSDLDWTFPNYNPNPEDTVMLNNLRERVAKVKADIGFAFDGDGDRLGVVDDEGSELYSDKLGLLIARRLSKQYPGSKFIIDVKSTGLFMSDPILIKNKSTVEYWITGHSYIKKRVWEKKALAGFEKSGHFFFAPPIGNGYDDGILSSIMVCKMLDLEKRKLSQLRNELKETWQSPTMALECSEREKYTIVTTVKDYYEKIAHAGGKVIGQKIKELITVNGVRVILEDGTWGLVRASSNKPTLVIVIESPISEQRMKEMFHEIDSRIKSLGKVGKYDQSIN